MSDCQDNRPTFFPEALWKALMNLPALRYMKAPVDTVAQLYEKYPIGNEKGTFAFVHDKNTFYTYHPRGWHRGEWKPISADSVSSFFEIDAEFLKEGDILVYDSNKKKFVVKSGNVWNKLIDKASSIIQVNRFLNEVEDIPTVESDAGIYFIHKNEVKDNKTVEFRALYIVLDTLIGKKVVKIWNSSDYRTKEEVDTELGKKANQTQVDDIATSVDTLAVTKAEKSVVDALMNGIIKQPAVDTYNDTSGGKTSLLNKYPNPQVGWDVLVREENTRYNWNGSVWVNMETGVYDDSVALSGGSTKTLQKVDDENYQNIGVTRGVEINGFYIGTSGNPTALSAWKYTKYRNNDLTKINLKGTASGVESRTIAFYNSFDTISSATYITGYTYGDASGSGVNFDKEIVIPVGTKCIAVTDRLDGNIQMYDASINKWKPYDGNVDEGKYIIVDSGSYPSIGVKELIGEHTESVMTKNGYIKRVDGTFVADSINISSDFIATGEEEMYVITELASDTVAGLTFYDEDKVFISSAPKASAYGVRVTVQKPANAKYYIIGRLKNGVAGITYTFFFGMYKESSLTLKDDEVAFVSNKVVDKIVKVKEAVSSYRFKLTDRNDNTFIGSMNTVLDAMFAARSNARFVIESNFTEDLMANGNGSGRKIIEFQKLLASYWGVQFIDISSKLGLVKRGTINTLQTFIKDGTHPADYPAWDVTSGTPNFTAVNMIARFVADELRPNFEDWTGKKILYIGTSIPAGYPYTGNPLAQYPKIIARLLGCECTNKSVPGSVVRVNKVDGTPITQANMPFLNTDSPTNYINSLVNIINDYDIVVFSHGRNDFQLDNTDFNIDNWDLTL